MSAQPTPAQRLIDTVTSPRWQPRWRVATGMLVLTVSWLAFKPGLPTAALAHLDKLEHTAAFLALAAAAGLGWWDGASRLWGTLRVASLLLGYGLFVEAVQTQLPTRSGSLADWAADAAGITLGLLLAHRLRRRP